MFGSEWFYHPLVQAGVAPFIVSLIVAFAASRLLPKASGLSLIAGFLVAAGMISGLSLVPQTATDKLVLVGAVGALLGFFADAKSFRITPFLPVLLIPFAAATIWLLWPVLVRKDIVDSFILIAALSVFATLMTGFMSTYADRPGHSYFSAVAMSFGLAASAYFADDGLIALLAAALGAAALGAATPITIAWIPAFRTKAGMAIPSIEQAIESGQAVALATGFLVSLLTVIAKVHADLPWASVIALLCVPLIALFSPTNRKQFGFTVLLGGFIPALFAIASAYFTFQIFAPTAAPIG